MGNKLQYCLFVDDELPSDKRTLDLFLSTQILGVIIPTTGFDDAYLRWIDEKKRSMEIKGNTAIREFLSNYQSH